MNRKSLVTALGALVMVVFAATAFAQVRYAHVGTLGVTSVKTVVPVRTLPLRDLHNLNLPPILRRILGNKVFSAQYIESLRQKLIRMGYLQPLPAPYTIHNYRITPAMSRAPQVVDRALQTKLYAFQPNAVTAGLAFPGIGASDTPPDSIGCAPPDTDMAVGANDVVEITNLCSPAGGSFKVWNKTTGAVVQGTTELAGLWAAGSGCDAGNGDNVVMYDQLAQRWILTQFNNAITGECVAISQTSDPTGAYYLYNFVIDASGFTDYPKLGVWPDSYFVSTNDFPGGSFSHVNFTALQKSAMLTGAPAQMVVINGASGGLDYSVLPAYLDGMTSPPAGDPGIFANFSSPYLFGAGAPYALNFWRMTVDWANPSAATLTGPVSLAVSPFNDGICGYARACIPQPSPASSGDYLDALGDRLMFRLAYRNLGGHQAMVVNQTVGTGAAPSSPPAGIRWYEIDAPAGATSTSTFTVAQQGTYLPADGNSRWMGSIAMDHVGDLGLGFTESSTSVDPSGAFTGQTVGAPSGVMDAGETIFMPGTGVQQGTGNRWGDYSATMIDPTDDCTFWTSQEYISATGQFNWSTAIGSFKFNNCSIGPQGTVSGTVTAQASGSAIAGATVTLTPGDYVATTGPNGTYSSTVPATSTGGAVAYTATAAAFGYTSQSTTVQVNQNQTTTQDFSLATAPSATLSGTVTDGSGHGWPLYAEVKVTTPSYGQVADLWTSPSTGNYSVSLPSGMNYTLAVTAHENGYTPASASATLATGGTTKNFALTVGSSCSAPGYAFAQGFGQDFNGTTFPPAGWTVVNAPPSSTVTWELTSSEPAPYNVNYTGGTGTAADADSNAAGPGGGPYDTSLVTPPIPVTSLPANPVLKYKANYVEYSGNEALDLDYSTDGGTTWTNISHWTTTHGTLYGLPGVNVQVPVGSYVPASGSIQFRWHYYNPVSSYDWYAQVDDVSIGTCAPLPGGLTEGSVTVASSGSPLIGATITDDQGASTTTFANPADPNLANGLYILFSAAGSRTLTATDGLYSPGTASVTVANNGLQQQSFALDSAQFAPSPATFNVNVMVNSQLTKTLTIANTGTGSGVFKILAIDAPPPGTAPVAAMGSGAPLHTIHGHFSPDSLHSLAMRGLNAEAQAGNMQTSAPATGTAAWVAVAPYPIPVADACAAADPGTGKVYSFTGISNGSNTASDFVYDPASGTWSPIANFPNGGLEKPACAYLGGKVYVTDGWDSTGGNSTALNIYDPSTDSWSTGTNIPTSQGGAAAAVALNGKLYVIGGCLNGSSCPGANTVEVYDPSSDSWSSAANYPTTVAWTNCGGINGKIYCAGGTTSGSTETANGYAYDPNSDSWTAIAPMPYEIFGAASMATATGQLLVQDGVTASFATITNQGVSYDTASDTWSPLPNSNVTDYRLAGACGFYTIGGSPFAGSTAVSLLPGYNQCAGGKIPWLTVAPMQGTLAAGATANVTLTFDGTGQKEFTTSQAYLEVTGSPYPNVNVPLTVNWEPQPVNLAISGSVSPTGTVKAGDNLAYTLVVQNLQASGIGAASQTQLTYQVPAGVTYLASNGDATSCTAASGTVTCDFGTLAPGASELETIVVQANQDANTVDSTFTVSAREPDSDMSNNTADISTNPNTGPAGPPGPPGPQGSKGSSGFGLLGLMGLLGLALSGEWIRRRRNQARR